MKPNTLYLEEMFTKNVEFSENGMFKINADALFCHYTVCGEDESISTSAIELPSPSTNFSPGWSGFRPWSTHNASKGNLSKKNPVPASRTVFRRTFPYATLCLDHTGKNVAVESTIDSIYVKLPEESVCVRSVLEEVSTRVGLPADDLVLLDAKFIPVNIEERGNFVANIFPVTCSMHMAFYPYHS